MKITTDDKILRQIKSKNLDGSLFLFRMKNANKNDIKIRIREIKKMFRGVKNGRIMITNRMFGLTVIEFDDVI